jgi:hypothetical protein
MYVDEEAGIKTPRPQPNTNIAAHMHGWVTIRGPVLLCRENRSGSKHLSIPEDVLPDSWESILKGKDNAQA